MLNKNYLTMLIFLMAIVWGGASFYMYDIAQSASILTQIQKISFGMGVFLWVVATVFFYSCLKKWFRLMNPNNTPK